MKLEKLAEIEHATWVGRKEFFRLGVAMLFIIGVMLFATTRGGEVSYMLVVAAVVGGYMAMNIGANDVANNVGPAVGSKAMSLTGAILIAAVFEAAGALIAGGEVVGTIRNGIIKADAAQRRRLRVAHAGRAAGRCAVAQYRDRGRRTGVDHPFDRRRGAGCRYRGQWFFGANVGPTMGQIATSWIISPLLGGVIAAGFLYLIKHRITYTADMLSAATRMVPVLVAMMAWAFGSYLVMKGLKQSGRWIWRRLGIGYGVFAIVCSSS